VVADRSGALYLPGERTLVVADLHLEKGSAFAARGVMLPPYDTRETLGRLGEVVRRYMPKRVVALGDSLHDEDGAGRLGEAELEEIRRLQAGRDWLWLTGNHDPEIGPGVGGRVAESLALGPLILRHEPAMGEVEGEIAGHLHPAARVVLGGVGLRLRCFIGDGRRLVLPAFGAFTGGLNVLDEAFRPFFAAAAVQVLGREGIYPVAWTSLGPD
jgi:DNA ligase-associated metallophosphoesterase